MTTLPGGTYTFDSDRSSVTFAASSSVHPISLRSRSPEGGLVFSDAGDVAAGSLVIPVGSLRSGQLLQDLELRRQINARRYPTIEATLLEVRSRDGNAFDVSGDITFMGTTRTTSGTLTINEVEDAITITGETTLDVRDFGFQPPNVLGMKVDPLVTIELELVGVR